MQENRFSAYKIVNRFSDSPYKEKKEFESIEMDFSMKSINIEDLHFTNFCKSMGCEQYKLLKNTYIKYKNGENILSDFEFTEIESFSNIKRLREIIKYNLLGTSINIYEIFKYKYNNDDRFQLFIKHNGKKLNVVLIDLFHLGIPAKHYGKTAEEMKLETYKKKRINKVNVNIIKSEYSK